MGGTFSSSNNNNNSSFNTNKNNKKKPPLPGGGISATDRAVLDLKNARDKLQKYKSQLEGDERKLVARAQLAKAKGDTKNALWLLKLRKIKLREVETVEGQLLNVMTMVQTIDSTQNHTQMLAAMKQGKDTLQRMQQETTVEDVLNLMDEIQEQNELEREMNQVFANVPTLSVQDEAAVEAELEALMVATTITTTTTTTTSSLLPIDNTLPVAPDTTILPLAPSTQLPHQVSTMEQKTAIIMS
jgi:charged multivesicular body protein 6